MSSETVCENSNATIREGVQSVNLNLGSVSTGSQFRNYNIIRQLPSTSTEADIFIVKKVTNKNNEENILKLYRYGIEPKNDILQSIKSLSEQYPDNFIRVFEADFDSDSKRWFEIQEYAKFGTLQAVIDDRSKLDGNNKRLYLTMLPVKLASR